VPHDRDESPDGLEEHLFRRESGRLVAILTRLFGTHNLALAEDVVQDAFLQALETWKFHGPPQNPSAWLLTTAKRRALDVLRREGTARRFAPDLERFLESEWTVAPTVEDAFDASGIPDAQLRMMFSCVHPLLPEETQIALVLHLLCGFSVDETAAAFLKNHAAMEKRLVRAKKVLGEHRELFDLGGAADVAARLPAMSRALYLLFNEGYHGASAESAVREELCEEALRLVALLLENPLTAVSPTRALAALMHFLSARLPGRRGADGDLLTLAEQDRSQWNGARIAEGRRQLELAAATSEVSAIHLEAAIAALHTMAPGARETDWDTIASLYDALMRLAPSPVVALNRAVAVAERDGPARGLEEIARIADRRRLAKYPFYFAAQGELELRLGHRADARRHFESAFAVARNDSERRFLRRRAEVCRTRG
jgi:RNA polymerase sigma-70 factor (ECF subfamily)